MSGESLLHAPCWSLSCYFSGGQSVLSYRFTDGESLLLASVLNLSGRMSRLESVFHTLCWNLSCRFDWWGVSLTHLVLESV